MSHTSSTPHKFLAQLAGNWTGTSKLWFEPDNLADDAPIVGSVQMILEGRFALYLYQSSIQGEAQHGMFTFGFNTNTNQFEASWVDSFHMNTSIMFCAGEEKENGFQVLGSYPDPAEGPDWNWRTEVQLLDANHLTITAYNITPEGEEMKATEMTLTKVKK